MDYFLFAIGMLLFIGGVNIKFRASSLIDTDTFRPIANVSASSIGFGIISGIIISLIGIVILFFENVTIAIVVLIVWILLESTFIIRGHYIDKKRNEYLRASGTVTMKLELARKDRAITNNFIKQGTQLLENNKLKSAIKKFKKAYERNSQYILSNAYLVKSYLLLNDYKKANYHFDKIINYEYYVLIQEADIKLIEGEYYLYSKEYNKSIELFQDLIDKGISPDPFGEWNSFIPKDKILKEAFLNLINAYTFKSDSENAIRYRELMTKHYPELNK